MTYSISVSVRNVSQKPIAGATVSIGGTPLTTDASGQTATVTGAATQKISVDHADYVSASSTVTLADDGNSNLTVTFDPLQVSSTQWYTPTSGNFTVQVWLVLGQLQDVPGYNPGDYFFIKAPWKMRTPASSDNVLGTATAGWDRFLNTSVASTLAAQGQYLAARWKNKSASYSPQLVSIWVPAASIPDLKNGKQFGGPSYLLYFTPKIPASVTDSYPDGEFYRKLGDRYLFSEMMTAHHMLAQGRRGIIVVPIGQKGQTFTEIGSRSGALRLLREVSHYVRRKSSVEIATQLMQDVFAVAVAGFSDGGNPLQDVLTSTGGDVDAEYFHARALREIFHLDCDPSSTAAYVSAIQSWYGNTTGAKGMRNYRIYTAKSWASGLGGFATAHSVGGATEYHDPSRSFVSVGGGYIQPVLDAMNAAKRAGTLDVEDNIPADSHHFFPYFFVGHAIGHSDIF